MQETQHNHGLPLIVRARQLFRSERKFTAIELNTLLKSNDSRKIISTLRHNEGMPIQDFTLSDRRKQYWIPEDKQQLLLPSSDENKEGGLENG